MCEGVRDKDENYGQQVASLWMQIRLDRRTRIVSETKPISKDKRSNFGCVRPNWTGNHSRANLRERRFHHDRHPTTDTTSVGGGGNDEVRY